MQSIRTEREPLRAQLVIRLTDAERAQLESLAHERDRSLSYLVRDGVKLLLARESEREAVNA